MRSFLNVTREERFFATLLVHACLSDDQFRGQFLDRLTELSSTPLSASRPEFYTEVAWLRDYWFGLGDFKKYDVTVDGRREEQLRAVLSAHLDAGQVEEVLSANFVRTTKGKIQSPGRWAKKDIDAFAEEATLGNTDAVSRRSHTSATIETLQRRLYELKWAYNAKPDLLVISERLPVFVEIKVESGIDYKKDGYNQARISRVIRQLMPVVSDNAVDTGSNADSSGIAFISRKPEKDPADGAVLPTMLWSEIAKFAGSAPALDDFTRRGLLRFAERAQKGALEGP